MTKVKFNKRKFFRVMYILSVLAIGAIAENGDITSALVFSVFI